MIGGMERAFSMGMDSPEALRAPVQKSGDEALLSVSAQRLFSDRTTTTSSDMVHRDDYERMRCELEAAKLALIAQTDAAEAAKSQLKRVEAEKAIAVQNAAEQARREVLE